MPNAEKESKQKPNADTKARKKKRSSPRYRRRKLNHMIKVGSVVFLGILFFVALSFAFHHYGKDGTRSLWWGAVAAIFAIIGIACFIQAYVLSAEAPQPKTTERTDSSNSDRAYIVVSKGYLAEPPNTGNYPIATLEFENTGKTPATNVRISVNYSRLKDKAREQAEQGTMPNIPQKPFDSIAVLGAGKIGKFSTPKGAWDSAEVQKLWVEGRFVQYLWGEVYYDDTLGRKHITHFSLRGDGPETHKLAFCLHGNWIEDTDKDPPERGKVAASVKRPKAIGSGPASGRPGHSKGYDNIQWTEYTEDWFYDVIWNWHYKPPSKTPRDIRPYCPECSFKSEMASRLIFPERSVYPPYEQRAPYLRLWCSYDSHPQVYEVDHIPNMRGDDFSKIKALIQGKLSDDSWRDVVIAQKEASRGKYD
jgi:hypothetical protein